MATLKRMSLKLLAFDTSTESMAVAAQGPGGVWTWNGPGGAEASRTLLPCIQRLMQQARLDCADLDAIAFGRGPGAFTGLRTACSVAQGLALGASKPVLPLDSLLIVAEDARVSRRPPGPDAAAGTRWQGGEPVLDIGVVMDARMGEVYAARYAWGGTAATADGAAWRVVSPPALCDPEALTTRWGGWPALLAGHGKSLVGPTGPDVWIEGADRAAALLRRAEQAWAQGEAVDPAQALPVYLRDKVAMTTAERAAARHGSPVPVP